jgi:hypothetical protein
MLAAVVSRITQHADASTRAIKDHADSSARALRDELNTFRSVLASDITAQAEFADRAISNLRDAMTHTNASVNAQLANVESVTASHAAHLRDLEEARLNSSNELAWTIHQQADLHARLTAIEERQERLLTALPSTRSIADVLPTVSIDVPRKVSSGARRMPRETLSDTEDDVSALTSPPAPDASIVSTAVIWRDNSAKSHCDPPINFPPVFLLTYDPTGFPQREFQHHCAGHLLPSDVARPSLPARTLLTNSSALTLDKEYQGMILNSVTPVNLVRFWSARRDYTRFGGTKPVAEAIGAEVSISLERKYANFELASDSAIWGALWELCELTPVNLQSTFTSIAAEFNVPAFVSLHDDNSRSSILRFSTAILSAVPHWKCATFNLRTLAKMFAKALPSACSQMLDTYWNVYNTIPAGTGLLSTIEPWNLFMATSVLEGFLAYSKTQASTLIATGLASPPTQPSRQQQQRHSSSGSPVLSISAATNANHKSYADSLTRATNSTTQQPAPSQSSSSARPSHSASRPTSRPPTRPSAAPVSPVDHRGSQHRQSPPPPRAHQSQSRRDSHQSAPRSACFNRQQPFSRINTQPTNQPSRRLILAFSINFS